MADIKTNLRELSVAITIGLLSRNIDFDKNDLYNSKNFLDYAHRFISGDLSSANNLNQYRYFTGELKTIIENGYNLGNKIYYSSHFQINKNTPIYWLGNDTQKADPIDISVGDYNFSLKEDSFILKNMGLYAFLNYLTGSEYERGLHIFSTFSLKEYDKWFNYSWKKLIKYILSNKIWELYKNSNFSTITLESDYIVLSYNSNTSKVPISICTNKEYMNFTSSITREKVFSKWISKELSTDEEYIRLKKECSEVAGRTITKKINNEFKSDNVYEFFRIYSKEYYYAKTTSSKIMLLRVPSRSNFSSEIEFKGCHYDIPDSQLNIVTKFQNKRTNKILEFRNECRFSHGQFNGTPEAKMYIVKRTPLTELYESLE